MEVTQPQLTLQKPETRLQKKKATEGIADEPPLLKKAKGKGKAVETSEEEEVVIRPQVLGRPLSSKDSILDQPEVAIAVLSSVLPKKDMVRLDKADDAHIFTGAVHDALLVGFIHGYSAFYFIINYFSNTLPISSAELLQLLGGHAFVPNTVGTVRKAPCRSCCH